MKHTILAALISALIVLSPVAVGDAFQGAHLVQGVASTATAAGTTTLTVASKHHQRFTGVTTQTVTLPNATTMKNGMGFTILNDSTGTVTVNYNGGSLAATLYAGEWSAFTLHSNGTAAGTWGVKKAPKSVSSLTALTASKALETNGSGVITASSFAPATNSNTASALVARDGSGNFSAGTITAALTGNVTGNVTGNADTATALAANPTDCAANTYATTIAASGNLTCSTINRASGIAAGTASHVLINDGSGNMSSEANLAVTRGGTGAATLTANNVILGNGTSAVQFVAPGSSGNVLTSNGTTWVSSAPGAATYTAPTQQRFTSGSNATYTTPANTLYIKIRMVGGGGGGGGSFGGGTGGTGGTTEWRTSGGSVIVSLAGGAGGTGAAAGGAGGAATKNSPAIGSCFNGGKGHGAGQNNVSGQSYSSGGPGAVSPLGGAGSGGTASVAGGSAVANSGSGGGGGGGTTGTNSSGGGGGGAGAYCEFILASPSATYKYDVGSTGTAGTAGPGFAGGAGGEGYIEVTEYYQ